MIYLDRFIPFVSSPELEDFLHTSLSLIKSRFTDSYHGDYTKWAQALSELHSLLPTETEKADFDIQSDRIRIGRKEMLSLDKQDLFVNALRRFMPWRKGPYEIAGIHIDTEWRSDWKWQRLENAISSLKGRDVLDIGCGNGYHCWRMLGAGANSVLGVEPMLHFNMQFQVIKSFLPYKNIEILPLRIEDLQKDLHAFDTVFSMGVLYHRRSPIDHLMELKGLAKPGAEIVLETLVIDGDEGEVLMPENRYAKMRNVWFIPSVKTLQRWLQRCGYKKSILVDVNQTSTQEQRVTPWMEFESLQEFLDPTNPNKTIEGYPAPKRALFVCSV